MKTFLLSLILMISCILHGQVNFTKMTNIAPVHKTGDWRSVNWIDYNNDGWLDLFMTQGPKAGAPNAMFINDKTGGFTTLTNDAIVTDSDPSVGASFSDIDNDGDLDAMVVNWYGKNNLFYLNNGDGTFNKISDAPMTKDGGYSETAAWGDYDNDGYVDLYVSNSDGNKKNFLYHNDKNGMFTKISTGSVVSDAFYSRSVNWIDYDMDGDEDLFVTNENGQHENLYRNDGSGVFTKATGNALVTAGGNTMSSSWGDYDNDGDFDVFLANFQGPNMLFRNDGNGMFTKINSAAFTGVANSFGSQWGDLDNDGDLDLIATNAFHGGALNNFVYLNDGSGDFIKSETGPIVEDAGWSYGCALGDYDKDGDLDAAIAGCFNGVDQNRFYRNDTNGKNWVEIQLTGTVSNTSAIGSIVKVKSTINGKRVWQIRDISSQSGYCGQNQLSAHFGLGDAIMIDSVVIMWKSGLKEAFAGVSPNVFYHITEGEQMLSDSREETLSSVVSSFSV
ncbi:MAG: CRTAC1 family protein, partial [Saprospiraceae bacterium]|nr:CRTAC1 family protein [Saprospiraceae bacterium]